MLIIVVDVYWTWGQYPSDPPKILYDSIFDGSEIGSTGTKAQE